MTRNVLNQFECKIGKAGEILCNTDDTGNVLLFVSSGKLVIYNQNQTPVADVDEGHFVLLPAEKSFIAIAISTFILKYKLCNFHVQLIVFCQKNMQPAD